MKTNELRGRIIAHYGTISNFAKAAKWSHRKASYIVLGRQEPTASDIERMAELLDVVIPDDVRVLFLQR